MEHICCDYEVVFWVGLWVFVIIDFDIGLVFDCILILMFLLIFCFFCELVVLMPAILVALVSGFGPFGDALLVADLDWLVVGCSVSGWLFCGFVVYCLFVV